LSGLGKGTNIVVGPMVISGNVSHSGSVMDEEQTYGKCGFHCSRCPAFKDNSSIEADREEGKAVWAKYFGLDIRSDLIRCEGCQATTPWKTGSVLPERGCPIRTCAVHNGVLTCAHCSLFPCEEYSRRVPGANLRQERESAMNTMISDDEYQKYLEPFDGKTHLSKLLATIGSEDISPPKHFSSGQIITPLPTTASVASSRQEEMTRLHSLLGAAFSKQAVTYAGQVLIEREKPYLWAIVWAMGLYGELRADSLVLESTICGGRKECARFVRKRDNTLYKPVQEAVAGLKKCGIQVEFRPSKKNWTLTLGVDDTVGGSSILRSLKAYISALVSKYGEPVYVDSFALKGKAFKLFSRLDMSVFMFD
jgi:hypothetical protein